jgi:hypothetical protein
MIKKFKITTCAFIFCLFGLTLMTVSPVFADDSIDFVECQQIKPNGTSYALMKEKKNCFRDLSSEVIEDLAEYKEELCKGKGAIHMALHNETNAPNAGNGMGPKTFALSEALSAFVDRKCSLSAP